MSHRCKGWNCTINLSEGDRRLYCSPKCRQSAYRARKEQESPRAKAIKKAYADLAIARNALYIYAGDFTEIGNARFMGCARVVKECKERIMKLESYADDYLPDVIASGE